MGSLESIHTWHHDIHEDYVWLLSLHIGDGIFAGTDPIDLDAAFREQLAPVRWATLESSTTNAFTIFMLASYGLGIRYY